MKAPLMLNLDKEFYVRNVHNASTLLLHLLKYFKIYLPEFSDKLLLCLICLDSTIK